MNAATAAHRQASGDPDPSAPRSYRRALVGVVIGLLAAAAALGVAELVAAFVGPASSPIISVGGAFIDATPRWLKEFAIERFGSNDKVVLLVSIASVLAALAALIGLWSLRRPRFAAVAVFILAGAAAGAALTRPAADVIDALPSLVGASIGAATLLLLAHRTQWTIAAATETSTTIPEPQTPHDFWTSDQRAPAQGADRRSFFRLAATTAAVAAVSATAGRALLRRFDVAAERDTLQLATADDLAPRLPADVQVETSGVSSFYTSNEDFYRVDTALVVPAVSVADWRLRVHGMVNQEVDISYNDLVSRRLVERDITLTCVSNEVGGKLLGTARWLGVPVRDLLEEAGVDPAATQIVSRSSDGMTIGTPTAALTDGRDAILAIGMNGEPLPIDHGFPVRMVVPGLYGYVSACKWIVEMEATTFDAYDAYWVKRGWVPEAPIKTSSRIDTPRPLARIGQGDFTVAGVAWAQQRGISRVEVRVDAGDWQQADLAGNPGIDTWRQWSWVWRAPDAGNHTLEVRATDGDEAVQTADRAEPFPSGSTGWHSVVVAVA